MIDLSLFSILEGSGLPEFQDIVSISEEIEKRTRATCGWNGLISMNHSPSEFPSSASADLATYSSFHEMMPLRDKLATLFFRHVYPFCPIIDPIRFRTLQAQGSGRAFFRHFSGPLFHAMMFSALPHMDEAELLNDTSFTSITEAHRSYYNIAKISYRTEFLRSSGMISDVELAKTALLLSYWCPQDNTAEVNSYWTDRAIYHTRAALAAVERETEDISHDLKVLYWACIIRNTLISFALRRPLRLHQPGMELVTPDELHTSFNNLNRKSQPHRAPSYVSGFIWICKISGVLNTTLTYLKETMVLGKTTQPKIATTRDSSPEVEYQRSQGLSITSLQESEQQLCQLYFEYCNHPHVVGARKFNEDSSMQRSISCLISDYVNQIVTFSGIVTVYGFVFELTLENDHQHLKRLAITKMEHYAVQVALVGEQMLSSCELTSIPVSLLAWLILPITIGFVQRKFGGPFYIQSKLLGIIEALAARYCGAESVRALLQNVEFVVSNASSYSLAELGRVSHLEEQNNAQAKIVVLRRALKLLDLDLTHGNPPLGS